MWIQWIFLVSLHFFSVLSIAYVQLILWSTKYHNYSQNECIQSRSVCFFLVQVKWKKERTRRVKYWERKKKNPWWFLYFINGCMVLEFSIQFFSSAAPFLALHLSTHSCSQKLLHRCVFLFSDKKMYCYLLVYCISRLNSIRTQEIVQVTLSFNLIKAQQDYYYYCHYCNHEDLHGTQFFSLCSCWWWSCCIRWLKWKENALEKECSFFHLPTCRTFSTQFDSSNLSPLQKLKFCVSPAFVDETLWRRKIEVHEMKLD